MNLMLEPVWMQTGEAAGLAAALAMKGKTTPAQLDSRALVRELCRRRHLVSFFNDVKVDGPEGWNSAAEYFWTLGFFTDYDVRAAEPLLRATARVWAGAGKRDPRVTANAVAEAERTSEKISKAEFSKLIPGGGWGRSEAEGALPISRGEALVSLWFREQIMVKW